jgi:chromosome segregation ATPase
LVLVERTGFVPLLCSFFGLSSAKETRMLASKDVDQYTTPRKKLLRFFLGSRDDWKAKCAEAKEQCKFLANQVRAVEKSREHWRTSAEERQRRLAELEAELAELKNAAG